MSILNPDESPERSLQSAAEANERAFLPPPPFAGLLIRLFAFFIDGLILYSIAGMVTRAMGPRVLDLNPWLPYYGLIFGFIYFWWSASPLARGRTLGMAVVGIHIVGRDGQPLGWGGSLRRTLVQYMGVYGVLNFRFVDVTYYLLALNPESYYGGLFAFALLGVFSMTLMFALAMTIALHPYRRGWHDLFGGSYVTRDPTPATFEEILSTPPDVITQRKLANHVKVTAPFWIVGLMALSVAPIQMLTTGQFIEQQRHLKVLNEGPLAEVPLSATQIIYPAQQAVEDFQKAVSEYRAQMQSRGEEVPTTETLRTISPNDGRTVVLVLYQEQGHFPESELQSPALREVAERLREEAARLWPQYRDAWQEKTETALPEADRFFVYILEESAILFHKQVRYAAEIAGPLDAAAGRLLIQKPTFTLNRSDQPAAATSDAATTQTLQNF